MRVCVCVCVDFLSPVGAKQTSQDHARSVMMGQGLLLRRVQSCSLWIFREHPQEASQDPPKQKSQDHARPVVVWESSRIRAQWFPWHHEPMAHNLVYNTGWSEAEVAGPRVLGHDGAGPSASACPKLLPVDILRTSTGSRSRPTEAGVSGPRAAGRGLGGQQSPGPVVPVAPRAHDVLDNTGDQKICPYTHKRNRMLQQSSDAGCYPSSWMFPR